VTATAMSLDGTVVTELGWIVEAGDELVVTTRSGRMRAARASSCLLAPEAGDLVLAAASDSGRVWVLAVLERGETPHRLCVDGDATLEARGVLTVQADGGVHLKSREVVNVSTRRFEMRALDVRAYLERLAAVGTAAHVDFSTLKTIVGFAENVFERVTQRVKRSYRYVEELDVTHAHQIDMRAEETMHMRSKNTLMAAEQLMKVDASQIHLG
jgi:uncharacterized protein DUF3540